VKNGGGACAISTSAHWSARATAGRVKDLSEAHADRNPGSREWSEIETGRSLLLQGANTSSTWRRIARRSAELRPARAVAEQLGYGSGRRRRSKHFMQRLLSGTRETIARARELILARAMTPPRGEAPPRERHRQGA